MANQVGFNIITRTNEKDPHKECFSLNSLNSTKPKMVINNYQKFSYTNHSISVE